MPVKTHPETGVPNYYMGMVVPVLAASKVTMADGATLYMGAAPDRQPENTYNIHKIIMPCKGRLRGAAIQAYANTTNGSNESWSLYIRQNDTTDTLIAAVAQSAQVRLWANYNLNIKFNQGDTLVIKSVNPTWATNPADVRFTGMLYFE